MFPSSFPRSVLDAWQLLPSAGSRWRRFPTFFGTTSCSDFLTTFALHFVSFVPHYQPALLVRSNFGSVLADVGLGAGRGPPTSPDFQAGIVRISQVPAGPLRLRRTL